MEVKIETEFINLIQFLKLMNLMNSGGEIVFYLEENDIRLNDTEVYEKRKKIYKGDRLKINDQEYKII